MLSSIKAWWWCCQVSKSPFVAAAALELISENFPFRLKSCWRRLVIWNSRRTPRPLSFKTSSTLPSSSAPKSTRSPRCFAATFRFVKLPIFLTKFRASTAISCLGVEKQQNFSLQGQEKLKCRSEANLLFCLWGSYSKWLILFLDVQMLEQGGHSRLEQQMLSLVSSSQTLQTQYLQLQSALQEANHRSRQRNEEVERLRSRFKKWIILKYKLWIPREE